MVQLAYLETPALTDTATVMIGLLIVTTLPLAGCVHI